MKLILSICFVVLVHKQTKAWDEKWIKTKDSEIQSIIKKSKIPTQSLGIIVAEGKGNEVPIFDLNSSKKMIPASITKLVTAAATLFHFPPGTKIKTQILSPAVIKDGVLKGNLILKGGGDPSFVSESLWVLVNNLTRSGLTKVDGEIVVDDGLFDRERFDSSRQKVRVDRAYDAPTGAMSFNWNSVNVYVRPGAEVGQAAQVFLDPLNDYMELKGTVKTIGKSKESNVQIDRDENGDSSKNLVKVSGTIALDSKELAIYKNITSPDIWAGFNLKGFLKQRGIEVSGGVKNGPTPENAQLLAEVESKPIEQMLADMNKFSNNFVAEMLTKLIASKFETPANLNKGMDRLREYLGSIGVKPQEFEISNPSGLTRDNLMTPHSLWRVLSEMREQFQYQPEFVTSLPIAGIDGTLKRRLKSTRGERWVRAKTGYLNGVVTLGGYLGRRDGNIIPFVMMFNGSADENSVRELYDKILLALLE